MNQEDFEQLVLSTVARTVPGNSVEIRNRYMSYEFRERVLVIEMGKYCPVYDICRTYDSYLHGESLEGILQNLSYMIGVSQEKPAATVAMLRMSSFESVRKYLSLILLDGKAAEHLNGIAHYSKLGFAAVIRVDCGRWGRGRLYVDVGCWKLKEWGVDLETCYQAAMENMVRNGIRLEHIESFMMHPKGSKVTERSTDVSKPVVTSGFYVLTAKSARFGASFILNDSIMKECAKVLKVTRNMAILPSSVNELILVPNVKKASIPKLKKLIGMVNGGKQMRGIALAGHVYLYNVKKGIVVED